MGDEDIGAAAMLVSRDGEEVSGNVVEGYSGMLNMNLSLNQRLKATTTFLVCTNQILCFSAAAMYKSPSIVIVYAASVINPSGKYLMHQSSVQYYKEIL